VTHMHPTTYREQVAAEVRAAIARKHITALAVSEQTGIPRSTLSRKLNALAPLTVDEAVEIARVLGVEPGTFFPLVAHSAADAA